MKILVVILGVLVLFWGGDTDKRVCYLKSYSVPAKNDLDTLKDAYYSYNVYEKEGKVYYSKYSRKHLGKHLEKKKYPYKYANLPFMLSRDSFSYHEGYGGRLSTLKIDDGWLLAFNRGEFGGSCWWYNEDGSKRELIASGLINIRAFHQIEDKIYVMEGLNHLGGPSGQIMELDWKSTTQRFNDFMEIPFIRQGGSYTIPEDWSATPVLSVIIHDNEFLILTSANLIKISLDKKVECLVDYGPWFQNGVSATSMVVDKKYIYIGMNGGIFKTNLKNPSKQEWLKE